MSKLDLLSGCKGFLWDEGNLLKSWEKHEVTPAECEQLFFNQPLIVAEDEKHSSEEARFFTLGQTDTRSRLFVVFTVRNSMIRVISARDMKRKERKAFETS